MLSCDWCGREIYGNDQVGYGVALEPFDPLALRTSKSPRLEDKKNIITSLHFHEKPCREAWLHEAATLAADHEPTEEELNAEHGRVDPDEEEAPPSPADEEERRRQEWRCLPKHEQDRMVLEALGDGGYATNRDITEKLHAAAGPSPSPYREEIASVTRRLKEAGELEVQHGQWGKARVRYRRSEPNDEVKELQRLLDEGGKD